MGDRSVVAFIDRTDDTENSEGIIFLYGHWGGTNMQKIVLDTIARTPGRHDDSGYLIRRCMVCAMQGEGGGETGFGITLGGTDNEYDILVVDTVRKRVFFSSDPGGAVERRARIFASAKEQLGGLSFADLVEGKRLEFDGD
jgi:hypothetical protein